MTANHSQVDLRALLAVGVGEVLETMFFTEAEPVDAFPPSQGEIQPSIAVVMHFRGMPSGQFWLWLGADTAAALGAGFLGLDPDEVSAGEREEITAELANMICGAVVSRFESEAAIELSAPVVVARDIDFDRIPMPRDPALVQRYQLQEGRMAVAFDFQQDEDR